LNKIQPKTLFVGKNQVYLPTCHSTNDIAAEIIQKNGLIDGTVIITDHQTAGKGQRGNTWQSNRGDNILLSFTINTSFLDIKKQFLLSMTVSNAILETLKYFTSNQLKIKWPNDIYTNNKKIGGVLIESTLSGNTLNYSIIGIGLNVNQTLFENPRATSLKIQNADFKYNTADIIEILCLQLEKQLTILKDTNHEIIKEKYLENLLWKGQEKFFKDKNGKFEGKIVDINDNGLLKIMTFSEEKYYDIKEIEFLFAD
jgi:BirA family transcriptional regulator, biotin operon repressor / biotin---[acetyl-CoA-carboxylase] ligase